MGSEEELINRPRLVGFMNPTSPLHLPQIMTNVVAVFSKRTEHSDHRMVICDLETKL